MNKELEIIKYLLNVVKKRGVSANSKLPYYTTGSDLINLESKLHRLKEAFNGNRIQITKDNELSDLLAEVLKLLILDEICNNNSKNELVTILQSFLTSDEMIPNTIDTLNPLVGGSYGVPTNTFGINTTPVNPYGINPPHSGTGNREYDIFLEEIRSYFIKYKMSFDKDMSLSAFTSTFNKFVKAREDKNLPESNVAKIYDDILRVYFNEK